MSELNTCNLEVDDMWSFRKNDGTHSLTNTGLSSTAMLHQSAITDWHPALRFRLGLYFQNMDLSPKENAPSSCSLQMSRMSIP